MQSILKVLEERVLLLDGGMGSLLIAEGLPPGTPPDSWNATKPTVIQRIHKEYFLAGADAVLSNTFGASRLKLAAHGFADKVEEFNRKAIGNARAACPKGRFIAGDIGPSGKFLPPVGSATIKDFEENYLEQAEILADCGVDFFFIETMVDLKEAEAATKAVKKVSDVPVFTSITFQKTKRGFFTIMGNTVEECVSTLTNAGADVLGANCTIGSDEMIDLVPIMRKLTDKPLVFKPNAGRPQLVGTETIYPTGPQAFATDIIQIVSLGGQIIGGCCGTNPTYIKHIADRLKEQNK
ncbi:MAG: homocysteine S-methyltransferase family protein [Candidatus Heimdallarchaeota archaeon]